jgi:hypothetical protein
MNLEKIVSVTGMPGLYRVIGNRSNGLIIEDMDSGKRRFAASRQYQFTPLESLAIFTDDGESIELKKVFELMLAAMAETPVVAADASSDQLFAYFGSILPNYDRDRVHTGDVKKVIKWFAFLHAKGALTSEAVADEEEA